MAGKYRVLRTTPNPISTQQNILVPGFGVVAGATFRWVLATTDGVSRDDYGMGMGAVSFAGTTKQWACSAFSKDAASTSKCTTIGTKVAAIQFSNDTGTGVSLTGVVSQVEEGIRITWSSIPSTAWVLEVTLYGGDTLQCEAGTKQDNSVVNTAHTNFLLDMTIAPEVVLFASIFGNDFSDTPVSDAHFSIGMGNDTIQQACYGLSDEDGNAGSNRHGMRIENTRVISIADYSSTAAPLVSSELTAVGVTGDPLGTFSVTKRDTGANTSYGYFAFSTDGAQASYIDVVRLDTNLLGDKNYTTPTLEPMLATVLSSNLTSIGGNNGNLAGGGFGVSSIDDKGLTEFSMVGGSQEVSPSNTFSRWESKWVKQRGNADTVSFTMDFSGFTPLGFDFEVINASGNDKYHIIMVLEVEPWGGIFWENICTEFDHSRTAQEISDSKDWVLDYFSSTEGQTQEAAGATRETVPDENDQQLADLIHEFALNIYSENWNNAWHTLWQIREWVA